MLSSLVTLLAAATAFPGLAAVSRYTGFTTSALIPWLHTGPDGTVDWELPVHLAFRVHILGTETGHIFRPLADTGSQGVVLPAKLIDYDFNVSCEDQGGKKGWEYLSSSHRFYEGCWVPRDVSFNAQDDDRNLAVVTAHVNILAMVNTSICANYSATHDPPCLDTHRNITSNSTTVAMLGIGFGRESSDSASQVTRDKNPLRNITSIRLHDNTELDMAKFSAGYVISNRGIQVGLTDANTGPHTKFYQLQPMQNVSDWQGAQACITVDDVPTACGTALLDTGLVQSYLSLPPGTVGLHTVKTAKNQTLLRDGSRVKIVFGEPNGTVAATESFVVGAVSRKSITPAWVAVSLKSPTFVNTGRFFYRGFEVAFDDANGYFGLKSLQPVDREVEGVDGGERFTVQEDS
ncbi:hypothetical protein B0H63DRAFT_85473 [Podospora didyma]|uniref:Peptidase A1 domain-containing protein n=1 Tax=Podospora didyma TaxID=330526 RepID=A0AAE0N1X6_9PEZI|nr:hypothetical protein B0H63DRAFT_85473 [Podospora didyma]